MQRKAKPVYYWYPFLTGDKYLHHLMPDATGTVSICGENAKVREGSGFIAKNKPDKQALLFFDAMNLPVCGACLYKRWPK